jgi:hypothetical protein
MGGSSFLIYGNVKEECLRPRAAARTIWDRLFGRKPAVVAPEWKEWGKDGQFIDLPADDLKGIGWDFRDHIVKRFPKPWKATKSVIEYLGKDQPHIYIRGEKTGNKPPEWYLQLSFSGCAGLAEMSAELSAHWAKRWFEENRTDIVTRYLQAYGFEPNGRTEPIAFSDPFVPFGNVGYAIYNPKARLREEDYPYCRYFCFDQGFMEFMDEEKVSEFYRKIDKELPPVLPKDLCCCQWCNPNFDTAVCDKLVSF